VCRWFHTQAWEVLDTLYLGYLQLTQSRCKAEDFFHHCPILVPVNAATLMNFTRSVESQFNFWIFCRISFLSVFGILVFVIVN
jgi:hypothetical protein